MVQVLLVYIRISIICRWETVDIIPGEDWASKYSVGASDYHNFLLIKPLLNNN